METREGLGRVVLVLPFDNRSGQSNLDWIGDSFPDTFSQRLMSTGFLTISRDDRLDALEHLGLPASFKPSRATTIRIAQTLDADFVVVGSFTAKDKRIQVQARVLEVNRLRMSAPIEDSAELGRLLDAENATAWKVARVIDPHLQVAQATFLAASAGVKLSSFENYIRGVDAVSPAERLKRLQAAVLETPNYPAALLALGKAQYAQRDYEHAAQTFGKVPATDRRSLEAEFYLGLSRFNMAKYAEAERAFASVAERLPLPEVVNNEGVARSRQGRDASAIFQRAVSSDPNDADFHYNLAVSLLRRGDRAGAQTEVAEALRLKPNDAEAGELRSRLAGGGAAAAPVKVAASAGGGAGGGAGAGAAGTGAGTGSGTGFGTGQFGTFDPQERIRRTYSEASFRQAAFQLDQIRTLRMATLSPGEQAAQLTLLGRDYLGQGLLPEAEQKFEAAILVDPGSYAAHAALAEVRERSGSEAEARLEARRSLDIRKNAAAYLELARLELQAKEMAASAADVKHALDLEPGNTAALGMKQALQARGQALP